MSTPQDRPSSPKQDNIDIEKSVPTSLHSKTSTMDATPRAESFHSNDDMPKDQYLSGLKLITVIVAVSLVCFLVLLDQSILSTATPLITTQFHSLPDVGWYAGAFQLSSAALQPLTGKLYTHFRIKYTFLIFLFVFEVGSLLCGVAQSSLMLIVGRAVAGLGSSGLMNGGLTIITVVAPLEKRPLFTGMALGISQLGLVSGPLIGGALTEYTTWRWCFYINLPLGALVAAAVLPLHIPDINILNEKFGYVLIRKTIPELDLPGFALFAPASVMFLLALQFGSAHTYSWSSPTIIGLFVGAGATGLIFIAWEYKQGARAMIPGFLLKQRFAYSSFIYSASLMSALATASYYLPIYFQAVTGASPTMSGVYLLPSILSMMFLGVGSGALLSRTGYYLPWAAAGGVIMCIGNGLLSTFRPHTSTGTWIGYQIIVGVGRGAGAQMAMVALQTLLPTKHIATGLAAMIFFNNFSTSIAIVLATTIFSETLKSNLNKYAPSIDIDAALAAGGGAQAVRDLVPGGGPVLDGLLLSYSKSIGTVFYMCVGFAVLGFASSWGMGWGDRRRQLKATKNRR
ncbi:efflux pump protein [Lophiotrema nucula]|uniref:Efflux pump protein n=1 Tax=Lophiotrema nucula TaxID=690887 RepID=A0A6A5YUE4_9PLEO|nr:efflux pump protein [Lophiotrema nucula]